MRLCNTSVAAGAVVVLWLAGVSAAGIDVRLIEAVKDQDREAVRALLKQKADVNAREGDGATALHWAVVRDDVEMIDALRRDDPPPPSRGAFPGDFRKASRILAGLEPEGDA